MMVPVAEVTMFERHMTEPEHEVAIAELEHQTALAEAREVSLLEPWDMSELGKLRWPKCPKYRDLNGRCFQRRHRGGT
jgi:hypothetical protein